jgi:choline kinase
MSNLTALVLAAGYGSRIADVTDNPKSLLMVNGKTLMEWHLISLKKVGVKKLVVVTGYKRDVLEAYLNDFRNDFEITYAINEDYRVKGNTYSMLFGLEKVEGSFLLFDADLIYDTAILKAFVDDKNPNQILVGNSSIDDIECSKAMVDRDGFVRMTIDKRAVSKEEREKYSFAGEAIGIIKYSAEYRDEMYKACQDFLSHPENISKNWEHVMNEFLLTHNMSSVKTVSDRWIEIDNKEDLERAKGMFE